MQLTDFWSIFDFVLAQTVNLFTLLDSVVVIDSPRFTLFGFIVSVIFLTWVVGIFKWLLNSPGVVWTRNRTEESKMYEELERYGDANRDVEVGSKGLPRDALGRGTLHKEFAEMEKYNQGWQR